jgi:hypothetical protein
MECVMEGVGEMRVAVRAAAPSPRGSRARGEAQA